MKLWMAVVVRINDDADYFNVDEYTYGIFSTLEDAKAALDAEVEDRLTVCHPNWLIGEIRQWNTSVCVAEMIIDAMHAGNEVCRRTNRAKPGEDPDWTDWIPVGI